MQAESYYQIPLTWILLQKLTFNRSVTLTMLWNGPLVSIQRNSRVVSMVCWYKYYSTVVVRDGDEEEMETKDENLGRGNCEEGYEDREWKQMDLSLFWAERLTQPNTMKSHGEVSGNRVLLLIDNGASHDFISSKFVQNWELQIKPTLSYSVRLGDGYKKGTSGCCRNVMVKLGDYTLKETYVFDLGAVDVILGVAWLASLGEVKVNWRTLTNFSHLGQ